MGVWGSAFYAKRKESAEAATSSYSVSREFLQYIYSVLMAKNHQKIRSRCLINEFSFTDIFSDSNHGQRAAIVKKNSSWLLPFYMVVATYCYYEKVRRMMSTAIVSYLFNLFQLLQIVKRYYYLSLNKLLESNGLMYLLRKDVKMKLILDGTASIAVLWLVM